MPRPITLVVFAAVTFIVILVLTDAARTSFVKLGVPRGLVGLVVLASLVGSAVNIPLWERTSGFAGAHVMRVGRYLYYAPPRVERQLIAVNVGGAIIPALISIWLLAQAPLWKIGAATVAVSAVAHVSSSVVPGRGIQMPLLVAPLTSALCAWLLAIDAAESVQAAPIAYVAGAMGTLVGADLLNLRRLDRLGEGVMSIGGAGVLDGIFLVGLVAAFIA
ncbi:MAG: DUF1614 domain-containing protein [Dehalococcoidia bacterium]|nr:DUF1614 domain-containing protein [Dehalococcoidia bacterium]